MSRAKKELTSEEKIRSRRFTTVITANGTIETGEEATVYVRGLHMVVTVQLLGDTPFVLIVGN